MTVCADNLTKTDAVAAGCENAGHEAYWTCSCGKVYADEAATTEITDLTAWLAKDGEGYIAAIGHDWKVSSYTVTDDTHTANYVCGNDASHTKSGAAEEHNYTYDAENHKCVCDKVEEFTITWTVDGDTYDTTNQAFNTVLVLPDSEPVKEGHTFTGWFTAAEGGQQVTAETVFTNTEATTYYAQWKANEYDLTILDLEYNTIDTIKVPYGANIMDYIQDVTVEPIYIVNADQLQKMEHAGIWTVDGTGEDLESTDTMPAEAVTIFPQGIGTGWEYDGTGWSYLIDGSFQNSGWTLINHADYLENGTGSDWYYLDPESDFGYRAEGAARVPYPTEAINGVTYAVDQESKEYEENKNGSFIDAEKAWFVFADDGKFQSTLTGMGTYNGAVRYVENGYIAWHPGLVEIDGSYYCFKPDAVNGGNKLYTGMVYVNRTNDLVSENGYYYFDAATGALCQYTGITEIDGTLYYFTEGYRLAEGAGLVKVGSEYIYVRSSGKLVVNAEYYVPANSLNIVPGTYSFDENGYMIQPELTTKNGVYFENNGWFYYVDGVKAYNAGLISVTDVNWYNGDAVETLSGTIYVRSNGQLATGVYYVTNTNGHETIQTGDKLTFSDKGLMEATKNGIVDGYYYVNGKIAYNAGLIEYNGGYIYVRSNGVVVMNTTYWITNVNDTGVVAKQYTFDENGFLQNPEFVADQKNGIVEVDGVLYYYENGNLAYAAGLLKLSDDNGEFYIYVRSNGQLATGKYWPTNCNGYDVQGALDFGTDGKCYI